MFEKIKRYFEPKCTEACDRELTDANRELWTQNNKLKMDKVDLEKEIAVLSRQVEDVTHQLNAAREKSSKFEGKLRWCRRKKVKLEEQETDIMDDIRLTKPSKPKKKVKK